MRRPGQIKVLEKEGHCRIYQLKDVPFLLLIVDEIPFGIASESGKTKSALRIIGEIFSK